MGNPNWYYQFGRPKKACQRPVGSTIESAVFGAWASGPHIDTRKNARLAGKRLQTIDLGPQAVRAKGGRLGIEGDGALALYVQPELNVAGRRRRA